MARSKEKTESTTTNPTTGNGNVESTTTAVSSNPVPAPETVDTDRTAVPGASDAATVSTTDNATITQSESSAITSTTGSANGGSGEASSSVPLNDASDESVSVWGKGGVLIDPTMIAQEQAERAAILGKPDTKLNAEDEAT